MGQMIQPLLDSQKFCKLPKVSFIRILILIAVVLSTVITTVIGQSLGILNAMKEQQAAALAAARPQK